MLEEVEKGRLGPVDVLDDERQRPLARDAARVPLRTAQKISSRRRRARERASLELRPRPPQRAKISRSGQYVIPSPYGRQRPREHVRLVGQRRGELAGEPRLADAGGPRGDEPQRRSDTAASKAARRSRELVLAADERRVEPAPKAAAPSTHARAGGTRGRRLPCP